MICSNCSEKVRPVVAIDIDGTLGNYHAHFLQFAEMWMGRSIEPYRMYYTGQTGFGDWFTTTYGMDWTTFRQIKLAFRQGGMKRNMPVFDGAPEFVRWLDDIGLEVWLTTTRPHERFDRVDPDTIEWLRRNGIEFAGLLYSDDKIEDLYERVDPARVLAVLDDQEDILTDVDRVFGRGIGIKRMTDWNESWTWYRQATSLDHAYRLIRDRLDTWQERELA